MPDWFAIVLGIVLIGLVVGDRRNIRTAWRQPSRWWTRNPAESVEARRPSQPLNVVLGLGLGVLCIAYGVWSLVR